MLVAYALVQLFRVLQIMVFARVLLSWFPMERGNRWIRSFIETVDAMTKPFKVVFPMGNAAIDIGPLLFLAVVEGIIRIALHFLV